MKQDEDVLDLLGVFHYVIGGLTILGASIFLVHLAIGIAMATGQMDGKTAPPELMGWAFAGFSALIVLAGWTLAGFIISAGRNLRRRRKHGFCLVMAGVECIFMPFGTILGIFTLVTLMKEETKLLFK